VVIDPVALVGKSKASKSAASSSPAACSSAKRPTSSCPITARSTSARTAQGPQQDRHDQARHRPAYGDKAARTGLRLIDLCPAQGFRPSSRAASRKTTPSSNRSAANRSRFARSRRPTSKRAEKTRPYITNTVVWLHRQLGKKKRILFEGAQGTFLDIDFGTYPFVTSSNTTAGGACTGSGVPPHRMDRVVGVMKAYTTRVGEGPLPTECAEVSDMLHAMGREFGATTGRARRCGWFDAVATRYARMVNGIDELAITNLDGLDTYSSRPSGRRGSKLFLCEHKRPFERRSPRIVAAARCRHHGRQRPLGEAAWPAARRGTSRRRGIGADDHPRRGRTGHQVSHPLRLFGGELEPPKG
jgi:adenylosuccinate synthase